MDGRAEALDRRAGRCEVRRVQEGGGEEAVEEAVEEAEEAAVKEAVREQMEDR